MKTERYDDPAKFREDVTEHLVVDEANNNIFFGVVGDAIATPEMYSGDNLWLVARDGGEIQGVAMRTPPWPLAFSHRTSAQAAREMVEFACALYTDQDTFDFRAAPDTADAVRKALASHGFVDVEAVESQGVYRLERVVPPANAAGSARLATEDDRELASDWAARFSVDVNHEVPGDHVERSKRIARANIADRALYLWEVDGEPVSMAAVRGPTPDGIRISLVYTPPARRRRGYASGLVAHVSQAMLDAGRSFVFLFTDMANPTSNHIYQEVGFERVGTETLYRAARQRLDE